MQLHGKKPLQKAAQSAMMQRTCVNPKVTGMEADMDPYENLANAIILQAVKDYRSALRKLKRKPGNTLARAEIDSIERFFRSAWYTALTSVDGEMLIRKLNEEV